MLVLETFLLGPNFAFLASPLLPVKVGIPDWAGRQYLRDSFERDEFSDSHRTLQLVKKRVIVEIDLFYPCCRLPGRS